MANTTTRVTYLPAFTITSDNPITGSITDTAGTFQIRISGSFFYTWGAWSRGGASVTVRGVVYRDFLNELGTAFLNATGNSYDLALSVNSGTIAGQAIDTAIGTFRPANAFTKAILGLTGSAFDISDIPFSVSGNRTPLYVWQSTQADRSDFTRGYESKAIFVDSEADDGTVYTLGRSGVSVFSDWKQVMERKSNVFSVDATPSRPYTWQNLIQDVRSASPFLVYTGSFEDYPGQDALLDRYIYLTNADGIYMLRAEGSAFKPTPLIANFHDFWTIDVKTRRISGSV